MTPVRGWHRGHGGGSLRRVPHRSGDTLGSLSPPGGGGWHPQSCPPSPGVPGGAQGDKEGPQTEPWGHPRGSRRSRGSSDGVGAPGLGVLVWDLGIPVWDLGVPVCGFQFEGRGVSVWGLGVPVWGSRIGVRLSRFGGVSLGASGVPVWGLEVSVWGLRVPICGSQFGDPNLGFRCPSLGSLSGLSLWGFSLGSLFGVSGGLSGGPAARGSLTAPAA